MKTFKQVSEKCPWKKKQSSVKIICSATAKPNPWDQIIFDRCCEENCAVWQMVKCFIEDK